MVSIGSIIGVGAAAALGIAAYVLYQSRDQIGGAFSRGVQSNFVTPTQSWFDNLFRANADDSPNQVPENPPVENPDNTFVPCSNNPADRRTWCNGYEPGPDQDFLPPDTPPAQTPPPQQEQDAESLDEPPAAPPAAPPTLPPGYDPNKIYNFDNPTFDSGENPAANFAYYYIDFIGNIPDQQVFENESGLALYESPNVRAIYPLGTNRPLSDAAFRLFGESKGAYGV